MIKKLCLLFLLVFILINPVTAYTWKPLGSPNLGYNYFMTFNGSPSLVTVGSITTTFDGVNSSGLYVNALTGSCFGTLKEKNNASHLLVADILTSWTVNKTNAYNSYGSITYTISNIRAGNLSAVNNPTHNELQIGTVPSTCDIGVQNGFAEGVSPVVSPYKALSGQLYSGGAGWAQPNIVSSSFSNTSLTFSISETGNFTNKLSNVIVVLSDGTTGITDVNGNVTVGIAPSASLTYSLSKSGYVTKPVEVLGGYGLTGGIVYNSLVSGAMSSDYYITVSPAWIPAGGSQYLYGQLRKYGTSSTNLTDIKTISWQWRKWMPEGASSQSYSYFDVTNSNYWLQYQKQPSGIYNGWSGLTNSMSVVKTAALPNPLSLNPVGQTGTIITTLYATDIYGNSYEFNTTNLIGDNTSQNTHTVKVQDAYTGGALPFSLVSLKNELTGIWFNITAQTGEYIFNIAPSTPMTIYCNASDYQDRTYTGVISGTNTISYCNMMASGYVGSANKTQVIVYTRSVPIGSGSSQVIPNVYVTITQLNETISKSDYSSTGEGIVRFSANTSTAYTITASKNGWLSTSQTINTGSINPYEVYLYMGNPFGTTPITYTPIPTTTPRSTLIGGSERNLTSAICGAESNNIVQMFKNHIACWGVEERIAQDLVLAGIIIAFFAFVMSKWGKGLGAIIGASVGFILSLAAGLIPVWAFFALVVIAGLIFGLKLYGGK